MKKLLAVFLLIAAAAICSGQVALPTSQTYQWPAAATGINGQLGQYISMSGVNTPRPTNFTIDATVTGTAPSACVFRVEGSSDGTAWYGLDQTAPGTTSCTANYMESIVYRPVQLLRIFLTYTQGDGTTQVVFHFTGGGAK